MARSKGYVIKDGYSPRFGGFFLNKQTAPPHDRNAVAWENRAPEEPMADNYDDYTREQLIHLLRTRDRKPMACTKIYLPILNG